MSPHVGDTFLLTIRQPYMIKGIDHMHEIDCICEVTACSSNQVSYRVVSVRAERDVPPFKKLPETGGMTRQEYDRLQRRRQMH